MTNRTTNKTRVRTGKRTTRKPSEMSKKGIKTTVTKAEQEALLRAEIAKSIREAQSKLEELIEMQRELGTSDRGRFCKLERSLRRNMNYTNLEALIESNTIQSN